MGRDKATLPFGAGEVMLQRVVRIMSEVVDSKNIVCIAAQGQELPTLPRQVRIARDRMPGRGPLEGLAVGMAALAGAAGVVYATSCDVPLLVPAFTRRMFDLLDDYEIVVPREGKFHHPLAAVYRTCIQPQIEELLSTDRLRPVYLFDKCRTREVPIDELRDVDSELLSLLNCNSPEDYEKALDRA
jgi:molybdopterin-guanine dinucleotide biosynthesis protein A